MSLKHRSLNCVIIKSLDSELLNKKWEKYGRIQVPPKRNLKILMKRCAPSCKFLK